MLKERDGRSAVTPCGSGEGGGKLGDESKPAFSELRFVFFSSLHVDDGKKIPKNGRRGRIEMEVDLSKRLNCRSVFI